MSRRLSLWEDEEPELPVRPTARRLGPVRIPAPQAGRGCEACKGTGWSEFFSGGGRVCRECGGSGRNERQRTTR